MKYISFVIAAIFLAIPATLFASTPTKELRIVDHQVYLFEDGVKSLQFTQSGSMTAKEIIPENNSGQCFGISEPVISIAYEVLFQDTDFAIVQEYKRSTYVGGCEYLNTYEFVINFHDSSYKFQSLNGILSNGSFSHMKSNYYEFGYGAFYFDPTSRHRDDLVFQIALGRQGDYMAFHGDVSTKRLQELGYKFIYHAKDGVDIYQKFVSITAIKDRLFKKSNLPNKLVKAKFKNGYMLRSIDNQIALFRYNSYPTFLTSDGNTNNRNFDNKRVATYDEQMSSFSGADAPKQLIKYNIIYQDRDFAIIERYIQIVNLDIRNHETHEIFLFDSGKSEIMNISDKITVLQDIQKYIQSQTFQISKDKRYLISQISYDGSDSEYYYGSVYHRNKEIIPIIQDALRRENYTFSHEDKTYTDMYYQKIFTLEQLKKLIK